MRQSKSCKLYLLKRLDRNIDNSTEHNRYWEADSFWANQKQTRNFTTVFTAAPFLVPWAKLILPTASLPNFLNIHFNIILPSTRRCSKCSLYFRFAHRNPMCISTVFHACQMPWPSHCPRFDQPDCVWEGVQSWSSKLLSSLSTTLSLLWANIFLGIAAACPSLNATNQVSHP